MAEDTKIQWCHHTFNPWRGCTKVSAGCANCYAETLSGRNPKTLGSWGPKGTRVVAAEAQWRLPVKWDRQARETGERRRVFCSSLADVFEDWTGRMHDSQGRVFWWDQDDRTLCVTTNENDGQYRNTATMDDFRNRLFRLIDATPNLDWLLLTKRPRNIIRMMPCRVEPDNWPRKNIWLGTSVENQEMADERIPHLLQTPAAVRFLSCEPLLGPVDLAKWLVPGGRADWQCQQCGGFFAGRGDCPHCHAGPIYASGSHVANKPDSQNKFSGWTNRQPVDWCIIGGESGRGSRPCSVAWVRDLVKQCQAAQTPVFVKQLGDCAVTTPDEASWSVGKHHSLGLVKAKGGDMAEWPEDLRVRDWPASAQPA